MQNENINGLNIFENTFLYTAYADDKTFFLKDEKYVVALIQTFDIFLTFSGLKLNLVLKIEKILRLWKCETYLLRVKLPYLKLLQYQK